ncbi:MAG: hypothetical protein EAZ78_19790 [Oscillatoriales cyanobacterium]|nr:MAG: hypothetical protein EAZ98_07075 [Oscillatoriales cyanobacterium]TAE04296.1 MAG: hypothetical protein EAZ96_09815 [Oscillatoriales cyanobacterium]TAF00653.1 MAG: hypothetical protein EAZ78_19790 [Oscillatoriales cyanobacterium]TAF46680.1 MAG: hypothetical protein EAZ68_03460 [Oscillatoriales cyanobacterium]TAF70497.1 MAG: hypothetical protein EAZ59_04395 [Oscillatoriales cyanobacterium]
MLKAEGIIAIEPRLCKEVGVLRLMFLPVRLICHGAFEAEPPDIYSQTEPGNKDATNNYSLSQLGEVSV